MYDLANKNISDLKELAFYFFAIFFILLFLGLKLTGIVNWSWWWICAPVTVPLMAYCLFDGIYNLYKVRHELINFCRRGVEKS